MSILPIFIPHAGCPHQCVFCNQKKISGQSLATVANAKAQIERWLKWLKPSKDNQAAFYGGSFTGLDLSLQEELLGLTDALIAQGIIGSVRCSTRPDYIDQERLDLIRKHQLELVELGVQSMDDKVLLTAERGHKAIDVVNAMAMLHDNGFKTGIQLMVGMPEQSFASVQATVEQVIALKPSIARIYPLLVVAGTPLEKTFLEGKFQPLELEEAIEQATYVYDKLTDNSINVIRIGLQPDDELCQAGNIIAGPFHPSMGELVKSRSLRIKLTPQIERLYKSGVRSITIECPQNMVSKLIGMKKCNLEYWKQLFPECSLTINSAITDTLKIY